MYSFLGLITCRQMKIEVLIMVATLATRVLGIIELLALWIPIRSERGLPSGVNKAASFLEWRLGGAQRQSGGSCLKESRARRRRHRDLSALESSQDDSRWKRALSSPVWFFEIGSECLDVISKSLVVSRYTFQMAQKRSQRFEILSAFFSEGKFTQPKAYFLLSC